MKNLTKAQRLMKAWYEANSGDSLVEFEFVDGELKNWLLHLALHNRLFFKTMKGKFVNINSDGEE